MKLILWVTFAIGGFATGLGAYGLTILARRVDGGVSNFDAFSVLLYTNLIGGGLLLAAVSAGVVALLAGLRRIEIAAGRAAPPVVSPR